MDLKLDIRSTDREAIQSALEALQDAPKKDVDDFLRYVLNGNRNALQSFAKGAVDNPKTWWIGIFSLQMQTGLFGDRLKQMANRNAGLLQSALAPLWEDAMGTVFDDEDSEILSHVIRYAFKYHSALIAGRLVGGGFTTFASTGGRFGKRQIAKLPNPVKYTTVGGIMVANFAIASYGAGMMAIGLGRSRLRDILFTILTGSTEPLPSHYRLLLGNAAMTAEELAEEEWLRNVLLEMGKMTQIGGGPVPIKEFCARPENINRDELCK